MAVVYLTTHGSSLHRRGERLELREGDRKLGEVRAFDLERVVVVGQVQLTTQAMTFLLDRGVDVSFLTGHGRPRGALTAGLSKNVYLRLAQFERWKDEPFRLALSREIVTAKLLGQQRVVQRFARNHPDRIDPAAIEQIGHLARSLAGRETVEAVRGAEGAGAAFYFAEFGKMVAPQPFPGRRRHPATDPVNALLSLGYVLLTNEVAGMCEAAGFDPFVGFFHGIRYGRQSLPLDIVEPFRQPVIDRLTLRLFNLRRFGPDDFEGGEGGLRLLPESLKRYLALYEEELVGKSAGEESQPWRAVIRGQVDGFRSMVLNGEAGPVWAWPG